MFASFGPVALWLLPVDRVGNHVRMTRDGIFLRADVTPGDAPWRAPWKPRAGTPPPVHELKFPGVELPHNMTTISATLASVSDVVPMSTGLNPRCYVDLKFIRYERPRI